MSESDAHHDGSLCTDGDACQKPHSVQRDVMQRARLANGGRGAKTEDMPVGKFTQAVKDQDAMEAIRMAGVGTMSQADARVFLNELRAFGWDVTRQCGGGA